MSIGRINPSVFSSNVEATFALVAPSFDFSLVKIQAPEEYRDLGLSLSTKRSTEAEDGQTHITARKLEALFADAIPKTSDLFRAYGLRASEIAKSEIHNPRGTKLDGIFADHLGADGTTIWAAATSGEKAIALHLLACMLARIWSHSEAVSIWVEIVEERKKILASQNEDGFDNFLALQKSRIRLSRSQLAAWDASARAWLQTADEVKKFQQTQLMLILNNVGASVNPKLFVYKSVIEAWTTSLTAMNNILKGSNQSVENGASLLGLASWHLYPDMLVLGKKTQPIKQKDSLVPEGTLVTIGIQNRDLANRGVFWSLPLAHLRYYGDPVLVTRSVKQDTSRVTIEQLLLVGLGSLLGHWVQNVSLLDPAIELMSLMKQLLVNDGDCQFSWVRFLGEQAEEFLNCTQKQRRTEYWQLITAGLRRYGTFLCRPSQRIFGLMRPDSLLHTMELEQRIKFLRHVALKRYPTTADRMIIQYLHRLPFGPEQLEYASVTPMAYQGNNEKVAYTRWIQDPKLGLDESHVEALEERWNQISQRGENVILTSLNKYLPLRRIRSGSHWTEIADDILAPFLSNEQDSKLGFKMFMGHPELGAVLSPSTEQKVNLELRFSLEDIIAAFQQGLVSKKLLINHINVRSDQDPDMWTLFLGLKALAGLATVYQKLHGARISLEFANRTIHSWQWSRLFQNIGPLGDFNHTKIFQSHEVFACIVACETGKVDMTPKSLTDVMAISTGNSLYVAEVLLLDPWNSPSQIPVKRIIGNVGRPGLVMMTAPEQPRVRKLSEDTWHLINHNEFDGTSLDSFRSLTLHLTISDWQLAVDSHSVSSCDKEVCFVNGIVAVHDQGTWVADLDILGMMRKKEMKWLSPVTCECERPSSLTPFPWSLSCIDKWQELIECPTNASIILVRENWQARLALAVLSVQLGHTTYIIPPNSCWKCLVQPFTTLPPAPFQCFNAERRESVQSVKSIDFHDDYITTDDSVSDDNLSQTSQAAFSDDTDDKTYVEGPDFDNFDKGFGTSGTKFRDVYIW